jgi:hypothetical protein
MKNVCFMSVLLLLSGQALCGMNEKNELQQNKIYCSTSDDYKEYSVSFENGRGIIATRLGKKSDSVQEKYSCCYVIVGETETNLIPIEDDFYKELRKLYKSQQK